MARLLVVIGLLLFALQAERSAAATVDAAALLKQTKEIARQENPNMDKNYPTTQTSLFIAVLVPKRFSQDDLIALATYYRNAYKDRWQIEIDFWDSAEAYRLEKSREIYNEAKYGDKEFLENIAHGRAKYRKNPSMKEHGLSLFKKTKSMKEDSLAKLIRY